MTWTEPWAEVDRLRDALAELVAAGEPFIGATLTDRTTPTWKRAYSRWLAAMTDARRAAALGRGRKP